MSKTAQRDRVYCEILNLVRTEQFEGKRLKSKRILLVDDDDSIRSTLSEIFNLEGCDVTTAADVPEALRYITANVYDVLLSDLHMPGAGDGLTVVSAMRHSNPNAVTIIERISRNGCRVARDYVAS